MSSRRILLLYCVRKIKKSRVRRRNDRDNLMSEAMGIVRSNERIVRKRPNNKRVRKMKKNAGGVDQKGEIDRISELPESIIHHILSFLHCTKDLVRTAVLSRNWKSMLDSYHSFDFDEKYFRVSKAKEKYNQMFDTMLQKTRFRSYVEKSIATRLEPLVSIDKFRLCVENFDPAYMESWINSALNKNVKELNIQVHKNEVLIFPCKLVDYPSIISLKLLGNVLLESAIRLCNLKVFSIKDSSLFTATMIDKMVENCPLLEDLRFVSCPVLRYISIKSLVKLRRVDVQDCPFLFEIVIASSNRLESFWYHGKENMQCRIDIRDTENLKNLTLKDSMMSESLLEGWILKCPLLEKLVLQECTTLEKIKISSDKLKTLALIKCVKLSEVSVDAPNLSSLEYSGHTIAFRSRNGSRISRVKLSIPPIQMEEIYDEIFDDFDGIKDLKLIMYSKQNMKIFEDAREVPQDEISLQKLELTASSSASVVKTVDNWLREGQRKSLVLITSNEELTTLISRLIMEREDHPSCCRYNSNKCWRHYMADVVVSTSEIVNKTRYDFTWRSRKM